MERAGGGGWRGGEEGGRCLGGLLAQVEVMVRCSDGEGSRCFNLYRGEGNSVWSCLVCGRGLEMW